jgi:hypothetical protein
MVEVKTDCKECIKNDVCGVKEKFEVAVRCIKETNTIKKNNFFFYAKDNPDISVVISCPKCIKAQPVSR